LKNDASGILSIANRCQADMGVVFLRNCSKWI